MASAARRLETLGRVVARSSLYLTEPVGYVDQPRFVNAAAALETDLAPRALLDGLLAIEREFGRDRTQSILNGPRTLDLDILLFGDSCIRESGLEIPHPRLAERAFVLFPLSEIASQAVIPGQNKTVAQLLHQLIEQRKGEPDAVVKIQSDVWRSGLHNVAGGVDA